jgi:hypothetical protein
MAMGALKRVLLGLVFFAIVLVLGYFLVRARRLSRHHNLPAVDASRHLIT